MKNVTAIIVNYHTSSLIGNLLNDICESPVVEKIFIVDNSGDYQGSPSNRDAVELITPEKNIGFAAGVNLAAEQVESEWILLINPDMRVPAGAVERLVQGAESAGAVVAGPRFYWDDERKFRLPPALGASSWMDYALMSQSFYQLDALHLSFYWQARHDRFWSATTPFVEPFLSGACMLINREWAYSVNHSNNKNIMFSKKGVDIKNRSVFDPRFFMYYEDTDLAVSSWIDGKPAICIPDSEMIHYYNQSPDNGISKAGMIADSHSKFKDKHYPLIFMNIQSNSQYQPVYDDIQAIYSAYQFKIDCCKFNRLWFEISVNPFFIPFAQTELLRGFDHGIANGQTVISGTGNADTGIFQIDDSIWSKLAKGIYYTRIRDSIKGTLKIWKWEKV